ncbi:hypothetical protein CEE37_13630 [candidate division LCP-89 bacterium B3_LCP]|uniref:Peptidase S8/S53 domain-containing protein n=1 Tax=candidate division LCP-89 bacterium B3_LCP TaxID=2012998 RepID=A0A532URR2_UNCL8|nr:MAG: hypothetical protein CEE37_13630 [candidate division LCP-89 bacterium B3_LCP]
MRRIWTLSIFLLLVSVTAVHADDGAKTVYLKWSHELDIQHNADVWATGDIQLDSVLRCYAVAKVQPALRIRLNSDPNGLNRVIRIDLQQSADVVKLIDALRNFPSAEYAVPAPVRRIFNSLGKSTGRNILDVPGDPLYPEQWFFPVMQTLSAWDLTHGLSSVVVAIVDNGTDWTHPDMAANIWTNSGEIGGNGIDDDGNGYIDDTRGWDFQDEDNNPMPEDPGGGPDYHGTHTAGLVSAVMNNGRGVVGMAPSCSLMPIRAGFGSYISTSGGLEGILYAANNGADVISLSWGGSGSNSYEQDIINEALVLGLVVVAAAGNEGVSSAHYPAAYDGVLAVAATDPSDHIWSSSNYGSWISVCAPGVSILSLIPDGYGLASGTSMATPLTAGVAALVKSHHPTWTGDQIYSQIMYTADDITAKNPLFAGMLGTGRVNAFRAVAETAPGVLISGMSFTEIGGDGDGRLDPGEAATLEFSLTNMGEATSNVQVELSCNDPYVQINQSSWDFSQFGAGQTVTNSSNLFEIQVLGGASPNSDVDLIITVDTENFYNASLNSPLWIDPAFGDHNVGNVTFTVTEFGAFGYYDYVHSEQKGSGFRYPSESSNALYLGALMAGVSPDKVSDCAYGTSYPYRYDWETTTDGELSILPGSLADQEGTAIYQDTRPPSSEQVGLKITQQTFGWDQAPDSDFTIISFSLENVSGSDLSDLYVGLYMDWDLINYDENEADWDGALQLGYQYNNPVTAPNTRYYGTCLLSGDLASYRVIDNIALYGGSPSLMTDADKYEYMSAGMVQTGSVAPSDQAMVLSVGPLSLDADSSKQVVFAVLGGDNLEDLKTNAQAAQNKWNSIATLVKNPGAPSHVSFSIDSVFPRPANSSLHLTFSVPGPGEVTFDLIDIMGRSIPVHRKIYPGAGSYSLNFPQWNGASGIYLLRGNSNYGSAITKIIWLK